MITWFTSAKLTYSRLPLCKGNGYITTKVLRDILHELDDKLTPEDLDTIIEEIDEDGSGTIDFDGKSLNLSHVISLFNCLFNSDFMAMMTGEED